MMQQIPLFFVSHHSWFDIILHVQILGMEKFGIQPSAKPKLLPSSKKGTSPAPNWQSSIDESSSKSIQALLPPALDSKLLREISDKLPDENELVNLSKISTQFLQFLPLRVKVVTGFCADNDKRSNPGL